MSLGHSHINRKDSLETRAVQNLDLKCLGWPYRAYIKTAKHGNFCEELLIENYFEATLAIFCCYDHGVKTSEAVQKIAADRREYHKCSLCVIIC